MVITAPLIIAGLAVAACALGACSVAHRLRQRSAETEVHCGTHAVEGSAWKRVGPLLISAIGCGLVMLAVLYFVPSP